MAKPNGGPAFPVEREEPSPFGGGQSVLATYSGMTLRDYFAAHALAWALKEATDDRGTNLKAAAVTAYLLADAMLAERAK